MVKCLPEFEYFTVFLKNKHIIFKIRRSIVTDYAALKIFLFEVLVTIFWRSRTICAIYVEGIMGNIHAKLYV